MRRFWNRKGLVVKKWRSRVWSIDPRVTNLTIVKTEAPGIKNVDESDLNLGISEMLKSYPQYLDAILDMEQSIQ